MATLSRWDPFGEMQRLTDQLVRGWVPSARTFTPAVDIHEDDKAIFVEAELPGMKAEDVTISVENGVLTLSGERKLEREDNREGYYRVECSYGSFTRSFVLPESANADDIEAEMDSGVLELKIGKKTEAAPKRIAVKAHEAKPSKAAK